jgi:hypothetical protein
MIKLLSSTLWPKIELPAANAKRKLAAVAYVSDDFRIKFNRPDALIVDASDKRIARGEASTRILRDAVRQPSYRRNDVWRCGRRPFFRAA